MNAKAEVSKRVKQGIVVSNKMKKTIVVRVDRRVKHPIYKKIITLSSKYKAHDEENICSIGDIVLIQETKPISKDKAWKLVEILEKGGEE